MSDFSLAFAEIFRAVQPDVDPKLKCGSGDVPDPESELDAIILACVRVTVWEAELEVTYGQVVVPTVGNGRKYKVTAPGVLGSTEPSWPGYDYGSVTSGTVTMVEDGFFQGSVYDVRAAIYEALSLKLAKAANENQYLNDARGQASSYLFLNLQRLRDRYRPVGIA